MVSNSSPLIALEQIGRLDLLQQLFTNVQIPPAVSQEISMTMPKWISVRAPNRSNVIANIRANLGPGESEAIARGVGFFDPKPATDPVP